MRIGVDIDNTLHDLVGRVTYLGLQFGIKFLEPEQYEDPWRFTLVKDSVLFRDLGFKLKDPKTFWWWLVDQVHRAMSYSPEAVPPFIGAPEALRKIAKEHKIIYLTERPHKPLECSLSVKPWLEYWEFPEGELRIVRRKEDNLEGLDVIIDDKPSTQEKALRENIKVFSIRRSWHSKAIDGVVFFNDWRSFPELFRFELEAVK